jgi:hypothetical protein
MMVPVQSLGAQHHSLARTAGEGAWRSFDCERVLSIKANGQTLSF